MKNKILKLTLNFSASSSLSSSIPYFSIILAFSLLNVKFFKFSFNFVVFNGFTNKTEIIEACDYFFVSRVLLTLDSFII